jgi:uncharacterized protein YqjF (DUF2071 family)
MAQTWSNLLFAHWPLPVEAMRRLVPSRLDIDTFDGQAWIGVVPFQMSNVRPRWLPPLPQLSYFPEMNVRTYVLHEGKPGVWFFSLDAGNPIAVAAARLTLSLPYYHARMACLRSGVVVRYASTRTHGGAPPAAFRGDYWPTAPVFHASQGSLEEFLTRRERLFSLRSGGSVLCAEIDHVDWPLQPAAWEPRQNTLAAPLGLSLDGPPHLLFADRLTVHVWPPW